MPLYWMISFSDKLSETSDKGLQSFYIIIGLGQLLPRSEAFDKFQDMKDHGGQ